MTEVISVSNLSKYYGEVCALRDLSLNVPSVCIYGFIGENGAGKTTLMRIITGLSKADTGSIRILGKYSSFCRQAAREIGALIEEPGFFPYLSIEENLKIQARLYEVREEDLDYAINLSDLEKYKKRKGKSLSLGMRQRLGIAQCLLHRPRLLILDEPTNGLDPSGIRRMRGLLKRLCTEEGISIFLSSHLLYEVQSIADYIGIIHEGIMITEGPAEDIIAGGGNLEERYFNLIGETIGETF